MLLRQEVRDGVQVLAVQGPVSGQDAGTLVTSVRHALALEPRGVVLDLADATAVSDEARTELASLTSLPSGWPRAALVLCPPAVLADVPGAMTASDRKDALAAVDARAQRPRRRMVVPHDATGPARARAAVTACCEELGFEEICDDVALVVSEMVTNAVRHAAPPVSVEVEQADDAVVIAVCDGSPTRPVPREVDESAEGGRGMLLVDLLTTEHGVRPQPPGKTVWARLRRRGTGS